MNASRHCICYFQGNWATNSVKAPSAIKLGQARKKLPDLFAGYIRKRQSKLSIGPTGRVDRARRSKQLSGKSQNADFGQHPFHHFAAGHIERMLNIREKSAAAEQFSNRLPREIHLSS